ncbi:MAG TPA: endonuclease III [Syntrophobacteraceae bacterium]|nr:endonuclease III [Syntrophobacteraceae bacterium]
MSIATSQKRIPPILAILDKHYPDAQCTLAYGNPLELLVATVLSAQCTDERVNQVTPALFKKHPSAASYAQAPLDELETAIRSTGFYRNKAKNIQACCRELQDRFAGQIPADLEILVQLPGIGRKTANVILGNAFHIPGIVVDTHVGRVSQRLGLTIHEDPVKIEFDLMELIPRERWVTFSHQLILHGRKICSARKPLCVQCPLNALCDYVAQSLPTISGKTTTASRGPTKPRNRQ